MYKLKDVASRATAFAGAVFLLGGIVSMALPGVASADALNPLTERSLMLSSSSPGWAYTDGSGNSPSNPNASGGNFAEPGSGANGQKTGETFSFRVSTDSTTRTIKGFTLQYCKGAAGTCTPPGNGTGANQSNLDIVFPSPAEGTNFKVCTGETLAGCTANTGWTMTPSRKVDAAGSTTVENNFITLANATGGLNIPSNTKVWIVFVGTSTNYITNPGDDPFFVRINDYDTDNALDLDPTIPNNSHIIDGGVTVANVMNESIHITTKVLETMAFSVGTENPDTVVLSGTDTHGECDTIEENDQIKLGDSTADFSLSYQRAYDAHSYWRLSTNSSGGATVYYAGNTLNNTVGDDIDEIGATMEKPHYGTEQFGLAIDSTPDTIDTAHGAVAPTLSPLTTTAQYGTGNGTIDSATWSDNTAQFAFEASSDFEPKALATNTTDVITCSTAKIRYIANIAPSTPAGIYTTKINYIAAPQY